MKQSIQSLFYTLITMDESFQHDNQTSDSILSRILWNMKQRKDHQSIEWLIRSITETQRSLTQLVSTGSYGVLRVEKGDEGYIQNEIALLESAKKVVDLYSN